jgi:hypothetical protein
MQQNNTTDLSSIQHISNHQGLIHYDFLNKWFSLVLARLRGKLEL